MFGLVDFGESEIRVCKEGFYEVAMICVFLGVFVDGD